MKITKDQARGMLVGKAIGDALRATLEFEPKCRELKNLITDMIGGGLMELRLVSGPMTLQWH